jgi:hypothetical protein
MNQNDAEKLQGLLSELDEANKSVKYHRDALANPSDVAWRKFHEQAIKDIAQKIRNIENAMDDLNRQINPTDEKYKCPTCLQFSMEKEPILFDEFFNLPSLPYYCSNPKCPKYHILPDGALLHKKETPLGTFTSFNKSGNSPSFWQAFWQALLHKRPKEK